MSDKINDGGPAFPVAFSTAEYQTGNVNLGMTLRDWFSGQVIAGLITHPERLWVVNGESLELTPRNTAMIAGQFADAMLAERERKA